MPVIPLITHYLITTVSLVLNYISHFLVEDPVSNRRSDIHFSRAWMLWDTSLPCRLVSIFSIIQPIVHHLLEFEPHFYIPKSSHIWRLLTPNLVEISVKLTKLVLFSDETTRRHNGSRTGGIQVLQYMSSQTSENDYLPHNHVKTYCIVSLPSCFNIIFIVFWDLSIIKPC